MKLAEGIRRHGFRTWYERELLHSHAHLALSFLCLIGIFAAVEAAMRFRGWADQLFDIFATLLLVATGLWALRRYLHLLHHAELAAHQAECPQCKAYGRLQLLQADDSGEYVQVVCRACQHVWLIDNR